MKERQNDIKKKNKVKRLGDKKKKKQAVDKKGWQTNMKRLTRRV